MIKKKIVYKIYLCNFNNIKCDFLFWGCVPCIGNYNIDTAFAWYRLLVQ